MPIDSSLLEFVFYKVVSALCMVKYLLTRLVFKMRVSSPLAREGRGDSQKSAMRDARRGCAG